MKKVSVLCMCALLLAGMLSIQSPVVPASAVSATTVEDFRLLGDNRQLYWEPYTSQTQAEEFSSQEIVFSEATIVTKLRFMVRDVYKWKYFRIYELEILDSSGNNVLVDADTKVSQAAVSYTGWQEDPYNFIADGWITATSYYKYTPTAEALENGYIEFSFSKPVTVASARIWCNWWSDGAGAGAAPKIWEVYGNEGVLFYDDFEENLSLWENSGEYSLLNGAAMPNPTGEAVMYAGRDDFCNYRIEASILGLSGEMGLLACYQSEQACYRTVLKKEYNQVCLYKGNALLAEKSWPLDGRAFLAMTVLDGQISVWIDENKVIDYADNSFSSGKIGVYANRSTGAFETVSVTKPGMADTLPGDYSYAAVAGNSEWMELTQGDFYVAENGDDANDGKSPEHPFKTVQRAQQAVRMAKKQNPNKTYIVLLRGGTYPLETPWGLNAEDGGKDDYSVVYASYKGETATISGGKPVTGIWEKWTEAEGVYVTTLPESFRGTEIRQLFVEDSRAIRAREPDIGDITETWSVDTVDTNSRHWLTLQASIPAEWNNLTDVEIQFGNAETTSQQTVAALDAANGRIDLTLPAASADITWGYLENALAFLDTPGEWYYDANTCRLYYYPLDGVDPNRQQIVVPVLEQLLSIDGTTDQPVKNLAFVGLQFCHTAWDMSAGTERRGVGSGFWTTVDNTGIIAPDAAVNCTYAEGVLLQGCAFNHLGEDAVNFGIGVSGGLVTECTFMDIGSMAIQCGYRAAYPVTASTGQSDWEEGQDCPRGIRIHNNYFSDCGAVDRGATAIWTGYANHISVTQNTLRKAFGMAIVVGWGWQTTNISAHHNLVCNNQLFSDADSIRIAAAEYHSKATNNSVNSAESEHTVVGYRSPHGSGDVNADAQVDIRDLVHLNNYRSHTGSRIDRVAADIDEDSQITDSDFKALRKLLLGYEPILRASDISSQQTENPVFSADNLLRTAKSATTGNVETLAGLTDGELFPYDSQDTLRGSEEFTFVWDSPVSGNTVRLFANYAKDQAPTHIRVYCQSRYGVSWQEVKNCQLRWQTTAGEAYEYVDIPITADEIQGMKIVVEAAASTWNHYIITEMELLSLDNSVVLSTQAVGKLHFSDNNLLRTAKVSTTGNETTLKGLTDADGFSYDSQTIPDGAEEFTFVWDSPINGDTLRLFANYAKEQAPTHIRVYCQNRPNTSWRQVQNCRPQWETLPDGQYSFVDIPVAANDVTGIKVVVEEAAMTWNHYIITELELLSLTADKSGYRLIFEDDFSGQGIDESKWLTQYFPHATTRNSDTVYHIENGALTLYIPEDAQNYADYTSMKVSSVQTYEKNWLHPGASRENFSDVPLYESFTCQYGYFEMRAKLPACGGGGHVAWWLIGTQDDAQADGTGSVQNGEIDILETTFLRTNTFSPKVHAWDDDKLSEYVEEVTLSGEYANQYHTYAMDWTPEGITFFVDGQIIGKTTNSPNYRMAMLLGIYTDGADWSGNANRIYPKEFSIDYIRVYQRVNGYADGFSE